MYYFFAWSVFFVVRLVIRECVRQLFSVKTSDGVVATSFKKDDKVNACLFHTTLDGECMSVHAILDFKIICINCQRSNFLT